MVLKSYCHRYRLWRKRDEDKSGHGLGKDRDPLPADRSDCTKDLEYRPGTSSTRKNATADIPRPTTSTSGGSGCTARWCQTAGWRRSCVTRPRNIGTASDAPCEPAKEQRQELLEHPGEQRTEQESWKLSGLSGQIRPPRFPSCCSSSR